MKMLVSFAEIADYIRNFIKDIVTKVITASDAWFADVIALDVTTLQSRPSTRLIL